VLAAAHRDRITIINTGFGRPFSVDGFSRFMRDAITLPVFRSTANRTA
jgi:enterobacteria phage integrase